MHVCKPEITSTNPEPVTGMQPHCPGGICNGILELFCTSTCAWCGTFAHRASYSILAKGFRSHFCTFMQLHVNSHAYVLQSMMSDECLYHVNLDTLDSIRSSYQVWRRQYVTGVLVGACLTWVVCRGWQENASPPLYALPRELVLLWWMNTGFVSFWPEYSAP